MLNMQKEFALNTGVGTMASTIGNAIGSLIGYFGGPLGGAAATTWLQEGFFYGETGQINRMRTLSTFIFSATAGLLANEVVGNSKEALALLIVGLAQGGAGAVGQYLFRDSDEARAEMVRQYRENRR